MQCITLQQQRSILSKQSVCLCPFIYPSICPSSNSSFLLFLSACPSIYQPACLLVRCLVSSFYASGTQSKHLLHFFSVALLDQDTITQQVHTFLYVCLCVKHQQLRDEDKNWNTRTRWHQLTQAVQTLSLWLHNNQGNDRLCKTSLCQRHAFQSMCPMMEFITNTTQCVP